MTMRSHFLIRLFITLFLIAAGAYGTSAGAQISFKSGSFGTRLDAATNVVTTPRVRAELVAHAPDGLAAGQNAWLGLSLTHEPDWHTYWKNPGDSGLPTELTWQLPAGVEVGEIAWPVPQRIRVDPLANYGYEGELLLAVPLQLSPAFQASALAADSDTLTVRLHASWLVCRVECIPEEGDFELAVPLRGSTAGHGARFARAAAAQPVALVGDASSVRADGERLHWRIAGLPDALRGKTLDLFAEIPDVLVPSAAPGQGWSQAWDGTVWTAETTLPRDRGEAPAQVPLVLTLAQNTSEAAATSTSQRTTGSAALGTDAVAGWRALAAVQTAWTPGAPRAQVSPGLAAALEANRIAQGAPTPAPPPTTLLGLGAALLGGLLGGLLLNLMPCVFPVLAIKLLALTQHGGEPRAQRLAASAYTVGVVLSFLALGGVLLALRAAGEQLGWGFQLQSPLVVALLAGLFTLIALNLAGVFEFGQLVPGRLATLQAKNPVVDALLSGVVAVAIASPCSAPFMGASLGFAVTMPTGEALAVFAALGLGMALPFLLAGFVPAIARAMPRPGLWMETFRHAMAFPMLATVVWLVWVLGQQSGIDGAAALLALLVAGSSLVWALTLRGRSRWWMGALALAASAALLWGIGPHVVRAMPEGAGAVAADSDWQPWSESRVAELTAAGRPVFVDFTAAWCITCQVNKRTTLADAGVVADFAKRNVALLRADWTRRDPAITAALSALGRSGVPVYVLYAEGQPPVVLSELLSPREVHDALAGL